MTPLKFLEDDSGNPSSVRLAALIWVVGLFLVWGGLSLAKGDLQPIPESVVSVTLLLAAGKVGQKLIENKAQNASS